MTPYTAAAHSFSSTVARRIAHIRQERFVGFPAFQDSVRAMNSIHNQARKRRMDCLVVCGTNGMGKTSAMLKFAEGQGVDVDERLIAIPKDGQSPIIIVDMSGMMGEVHFCRQLIRACLGECAERVREPQSTALRLLEELQVRTLVIDEFQDIGRHTVLKQKAYLSQLKYLANVMRIGIIGMSIYGPTTALHADPHLMSRFGVVEMQPWTESHDLLMFLTTIASMMSLHRGFEVKNPEFVQTILRHSEGSTKLIVKQLQGAAIHAILSGHERLDCDMLNAHLNDPYPEGCDVVDAETTA